MTFAEFGWLRAHGFWWCPRCPYRIEARFLPGGVNEALREHTAAHEKDDDIRSATHDVGPWL